MLSLENAKFLEDVELSGSAYPQGIELKKARELTEAPSYEGCLIVFKKNQIDYFEPQSLSEQSTHEEQVHNESTQTLPNVKEVGLRKSSRIS